LAAERERIERHVADDHELGCGILERLDRARHEAVVRVLPTSSAWFGVTYRDDKPRVVAAIAELVRAGKYPAKLF
jgi:hypothetical protein